jgi:hypothetical protein
MSNNYLARLASSMGLIVLTILINGCTTTGPAKGDSRIVSRVSTKKIANDYMRKTPDEERYRLIISVLDQRMALLEGDTVIHQYAISTALKGVSEAFNSDGTPRGLHVIAEKIGASQSVY